MEEIGGGPDGSQEVIALGGGNPRSRAIARGNRSEGQGQREEEGHGETDANPRADVSIDRVLTRHGPTKEKSQKSLAKVAASPKAGIAPRSPSMDERGEAAITDLPNLRPRPPIQRTIDKGRRVIVKEGDSESRSEGE